MDIGVVETLNVHRHALQMQLLLQTFHKLAAAIVGIDQHPLVYALVLMGTYIPFAQLQQLLAVAACRHCLLQIVGRNLLNLEWHYSLCCSTFCLLVQCRNNCCQYLGVTLLQLFLDLCAERVDNAAVLDTHHIDIGILGVG